MTAAMRIHLRTQTRQQESIWTFDGAKEITAGFLPSCSIYLMDASAGPTRILFHRKGQDLCLRVTSDLKGDLSIDGKPVSIASLSDSGFLKTDRNGQYVVIGPKTTGTISIGASRLQFWQAPAPKEPEFPLHPLHLRLVRLVVQSYATALLISLLLHIAVFSTIKSLPPPPPQTWDDMDRRIARLIIPEGIILTKPKEPEPKINRHSAPKGKVEQTPAKIPPPAVGFLAAVSRTKPSEKGSPFEKLFSTNSISGDLDKALKNESLDSIIAKGAKSFGSVNVGSVPKAVDIGLPKGSVAASKEIQREATAPTSARMSVDTLEVEGTMNREALTDVVNQNASQLRDCYERGLSRKPTLSGKVVVQLMVNLEGRATNVGIEESSLSDTGVERCIVSRIGNWIFPKPKGGTTPVKFPFIFTASSRG